MAWTMLFDNGRFKIYEADIRDFINNIIMWSCQRDLNKEHIITLKHSIIEREYVIGTFKAIRNAQGDVRCIDGQHRIQALKEIMEKRC